jgi:CRISPR/Cas system-associated exonuclease Cas4 (RecB family)
MKFYYRYVCGLKEPEKIVTGIDPSVFGKLLHGVMEKVFSPFDGKIIDREKIEEIISNSALVTGLIKEVIREIYHSGQNVGSGGNEEITANILFAYIRMILKHDLSYAPITIHGLERYISSSFSFSQSDKKRIVTIGGYTDRIDETGGTRRIIDYKTGNTPMEIRSVSSLFDENDDKRNDAWFQILMYCEMISGKDPAVKVRPSLYAVRSMSSNEFSDSLIIAEDRDNKREVDDYSVIRQEYTLGLEQTIVNIFSDDSEFRMTEHSGKCDYCPFIKLCRR